MIESGYEKGAAECFAALFVIYKKWLHRIMFLTKDRLRAVVIVSAFFIFLLPSPLSAHPHQIPESLALKIISIAIGKNGDFSLEGRDYDFISYECLGRYSPTCGWYYINLWTGETWYYCNRVTDRKIQRIQKEIRKQLTPKEYRHYQRLRPYQSGTMTRCGE